MYRIVPSDTPKERKRRAKGEREGGRAKPKMEFSTRKGEEVGEVLSLLSSSSSSPSSSHSLPLLYFSFGHSVLLGEETFYVFPSCLVFEFIRPLFCPSSVRPTHRVAHHQSRTATKRESGSIESEQKRARGEARGRGKGEGCLLGTKNARTPHPPRQQNGHWKENVERRWLLPSAEVSVPDRRRILTCHWR